MCLAIPMKITSVEGDTALVSLEGLEKEIDVRFLEDPQPGDYVIVHAGFAIDKLDEEEARKTLDLFRDITAELNKNS
ncbi:MAG TPA: HypC/HybG/HupF family hydrogenase formation chaperone [Proteobacteria bacterium]|nr:HypC/HybG/HupF family hydrogenase formation chaperone [Pseudomonadota bacterium]